MTEPWAVTKARYDQQVMEEHDRGQVSGECGLCGLPMQAHPRERMLSSDVRWCLRALATQISELNIQAHNHGSDA